jgi:hypothetical protein
MNTRTKQSWTKKRLGMIFAAAAVLTALAPFDAVARPKAPARCGPNARWGAVVISGCAIDECVRKGGLIEDDGGVPSCCVTTGSGEDRVKVCEELGLVIDLIVTPPPAPPTLGWSPRPFGAVSRFAR